MNINLNWDPIKCLGQGSFGNVVLWKHRQTGQQIATKFLKVKNLARDEEEKLKERWLQEYKWQQDLDNFPFIVKAIKLQDNEFLEFLKKYHNKYDTLPVIIMEYCNGGDLRNYLGRIEHLNGLPENEIRQILFSLKHAVQYLHQNCNMQHRDLKPENIIIHIDERKRQNYKLTDFGYARYIPDHTKLQSIVGTPQYVAPEVIRDGKYNKTVDYWSIGIIAFEILYGIRPFIPHCEFYRIMKMIQKKPKYCIAIKEDFFSFNSKKNVQDKEEDKFLFIETISKQNNSSFIFTKKLEIWLRLALDSDYKSRGQIGNELKFYTELDTILNSKIITVFSLNSYQFLSYEVTQFMTKEKFLERLCQEIKIEQRNLYLILPLLHPKKSLKNISLAMDFYVKEWIDREPGTPLAMLYIMDIRQCDFNVKCLEFSSIVMNCMELSHDTCISLSKGLLEQFELDTHFLISNEQRHLEAYLEGLQCYAVSIGNDLLNLRPQIDNMQQQILITKGRIQQFSLTVDELNKHMRSKVSQQIWLKKIEAYHQKIHEFYEKYFKTIETNYQRTCMNCKTQATEKVYENLSNSDIYKLKEYRQSLVEDDQNSSESFGKRLLKSQLALDYLRMRKKIFKNSLLRDIKENLNSNIEFYRKTKHDIKNKDTQYLNHFNKVLDNDCKELLQLQSFKFPMPLQYENNHNHNEILINANEIMYSISAYMNDINLNETSE